MRDYNHKELYPNTKQLSSSQVLDFIRNPSDFHVTWVMGVREEPSQPMINGSVFSELFAGATGEERKELLSLLRPRRLIDTYLAALKVLPNIPPQFCEVSIRAKVGSWKVRVTPDALLAEQYEIIENKTGQKPWDQERCNFDQQITMQAWAFWKKYGVPPKRIRLNWVNTSLHSTKVVESFVTRRTMTSIKRMDALVQTVIEHIEAGDFTSSLY